MYMVKAAPYGGDAIVYKYVRSLEEFKNKNKPDAVAMVPRQVDAPSQYTSFDYLHSCDPDVLRVPDPVDATKVIHYLYYGGATSFGTYEQGGTRIGIAKSTNGGQSFTRVSSNPLLGTDVGRNWGTYGVGQPSVTEAVISGTKWYYMIYTYENVVRSSSTPGYPVAPAPTPVIYNDPDPIGLRVIRSTSPEFTSPQVIRGPSGSQGGTIPFGDDADTKVRGASVSLVFNPARSQFIIVDNVTSPLGSGSGIAKVRLHHYDTSWQFVGYTDFEQSGLFRFGEGVSLVSTATKQLARSFNNLKHSLIFVASTVHESTASPSCDTSSVDATCWIRGPMKFVRFTQGADCSGSRCVFQNYSIGGWDIGLYNPLGNGQWFNQVGEGSGYYSDQTSWSWGPFTPGRIITGDFDGDGHWDMGFYNPLNDGVTYVQYGTGDGSTFGNQGNTGAWAAGYKPFNGDFNGDGKWDLGLEVNGGLWIRYGTGVRSAPFTTAPYETYYPWWAGQPGDFSGVQLVSAYCNSDSMQDLIAYNALTGIFYIRLAKTGGQFFTPPNEPEFSVTNFSALPGYSGSLQAVAGDFNGDGTCDLGLYHVADGRVAVRFGVYNASAGTLTFSNHNQKVFSWVSSGTVFSGRFQG